MKNWMIIVVVVLILATLVAWQVVRERCAFTRKAKDSGAILYIDNGEGIMQPYISVDEPVKIAGGTKFIVGYNRRLTDFETGKQEKFYLVMDHIPSELNDITFFVKESQTTKPKVC